MIFVENLQVSKLGPIWVACDETSLLATGFSRRGLTAALRLWGVTSLPQSAEKGPLFLQHFFNECRDYAAGQPVKFEFPWRLPENFPPFLAQVLKACRPIPWGQQISYGELASRTGRPGAARAVGQAMARNPLPLVIPCHRVLASKGGLGGFSAGLPFKRKLLECEGKISQNNHSNNHSNKNI